MRRICTLFSLVILLSGARTAAQDSLYIQAGSLYEEGKFEEALELYQAVVDSGFAAADLYYNMGNAAFRSNSIGSAILYYEKALKLDPGHEDAAHNLRYVSRYRVDLFDEVPVFFLRNWTEGFVRLFSERVWSLLALALFLLSLTSLFFFLFSRGLKLKKAGFFTAVAALLLFAISMASAISRHREIHEPGAAIVLAPSVVVRSTPSETGTELFILHEGTRVEIGEEVTGWQNIRIVDGREGWIPLEAFEPI